MHVGKGYFKLGRGPMLAEPPLTGADEMPMWGIREFLADTHRERDTHPLKGVCECLVSLMTCMTLMRVGRVSRESLPANARYL